MLAVTWEYGSEISWLEVRLSRSEQGTVLQLSAPHRPRGYRGEWNEFGPGAVGVGWDMALWGLGRHLDSGEAVDPSDARPGWPRRKASAS